MSPIIRCVVCVVVVTLVGCGERDEAARDRFEAAVAEQDLVAARGAAIELGRELPDTPEAVVEVARMLADIGEMNEARWLLEAAIPRHPGELQLVIGLVETSVRVGDAAAALDALEGIPRDSEQAAYGEILRARALVLMGELDEALAVLAAGERRFDDRFLFQRERIALLAGESRQAEALTIVRRVAGEPDLAPEVAAWLALQEVDLVWRIEGGDAALELLDPILAADPGSVDALRARATILIRKDRADEALAELRRAVASQPDEPVLIGLAAQAAVVQNDVEAAEEFLRRHVEVEPSAGSLASLASFLYRQGRADEGAEILGELSAVDDPVQRIELRYQRIAMQIEAGELESARQGIEAFRRDHPRNPRLDYLLARLDLAEGRPESAAQRLQLVASRLDRTDVKHLLGVALEHAGDLEGAETRYGLVAMAGPSQVASWVGLLRVLEAQRKWEHLANMAAIATRIAVIRDIALQSLATAKLALGRFDEAEPVLRLHLEEHPEDVLARMRLSVALRQQGRADEALQVLDDAGEEQARHSALVAERATLLGVMGRHAEALALLDRSEGDVLELRHARIYLLFASGRPDDALEAATQAAQSDPRDPVPHRMRADYLSSRGRFAEAVEPYRRAIALEPGSADLHLRLAIALERAGRERESIDAYRRVIELDVNAVGARNNLALLLARAGELREAVRVAQAAWARAEADPIVMDTLAALYLEAGLAPRAAGMLEKARGIAPESADVAIHLALAYRDTDRPEQARRLLVELSPRAEDDAPLRERIEDVLASLP